jgi:hypothetical protein
MTETYSSPGEFFFWAFGLGFACTLLLYVSVLAWGVWILREFLPKAVG